MERSTNRCATAIRQRCRQQHKGKTFLRKETQKPKRRVPVTASNAWPTSIVEMEREVENQVAAPAATRTPNLHRAQETLIESADGRVATVLARKGLWVTALERTKQPVHVGPPSCLAEWWQSGPRRQGFACAAQNAPLTAPGRSANPSARKEGWISGRAKSKST